MHLPNRWREGLCLTLGIGLVVAPLVFGFLNDAPAAWNAMASGALLCALGTAALGHPRAWEEALLLVLGAWIASAPLVLGFATDAVGWVHLGVGAVVMVDALWSLLVAWHPPSGRPHG